MSLRAALYTMFLVSLSHISLQAQNLGKIVEDSTKVRNPIVYVGTLDSVCVTTKNTEDTFDLDDMISTNSGLSTGTGFDMGKEANMRRAGAFSRLPIAYPRIENLPFSMSPVYIHGSRFVNKMHYVDGASTMLDGLIWNMGIKNGPSRRPSGAGSEIMIDEIGGDDFFTGLIGTGDISSHLSGEEGYFRATVGGRMAGPLIIRELVDDARVLPTTLDFSALLGVDIDDWKSIGWSQYSTESRSVNGMFGLDSLITNSNDLKSLAELSYLGLGNTVLRFSVNHEDNRSTVHEVIDSNEVNDLDFGNIHTGITLEGMNMPVFELPATIGVGGAYHKLNVRTDSTHRDNEFLEMWANASATIWKFDIGGSIYRSPKKGDHPLDGYHAESGITLTPDILGISRARLSVSYSDIADRFVVNNRHYTDMVRTDQLPDDIDGIRRLLRLELDFGTYATVTVSGNNTNVDWNKDNSTKAHHFYGWDFMAAGAYDVFSAILKYSRYFEATVNGNRLPGSVNYIWEANLACQLEEWAFNVGYLLHSRLIDRDRETDELVKFPASTYYNAGLNVRFDNFYVGFEWQNIEGAFKNDDAVISRVNGSKIVLPSLVSVTFKVTGP